MEQSLFIAFMNIRISGLFLTNSLISKLCKIWIFITYICVYGQYILLIMT